MPVTSAPKAALGVLALAAALAGCMAQDGGDEAAAVRPSPLAGRLDLTGCTGFAGGTNLYPGPVAPGQSPPGWEPAATDPWGAVILAGYECSRIGLGPLERGPVRLVWDAHMHTSVPGACLAGRTSGTEVAILNALLVDDPDVGAHLRDVYGLPAHHADIAVEARPQADLVEHTWSWTPPGGETSSLTLVDDGERNDVGSAHRLFWPRGDGVGRLDLHYNHTGPTVVPWPGHGPMQPPMLLASTPQAMFAGSARPFAALSGQGAFTLFADTGCRQPEAEALP